VLLISYAVELCTLGVTTTEQLPASTLFLAPHAILCVHLAVTRVLCLKIPSWLQIVFFEGGDKGSNEPKKSWRERKVLTLVEKVEIIKKIIESGMSYAAYARGYERKVTASVPATTKVTQHARDPALIKMEKALKVWIEDLNHRCIPLDSRFIWEKDALLYA
ncbi:Tigger transposable element-derived protein 1-like 211, partial [Homarus americanus]